MAVVLNIVRIVYTYRQNAPTMRYGTQAASNPRGARQFGRRNRSSAANGCSSGSSSISGSLASGALG
jgi:hypothetical protein